MGYVTHYCGGTGGTDNAGIEAKRKQVQDFMNHGAEMMVDEWYTSPMKNTNDKGNQGFVIL